MGVDQRSLAYVRKSNSVIWAHLRMEPKITRAAVAGCVPHAMTVAAGGEKDKRIAGGSMAWVLLRGLLCALCFLGLGDTVAIGQGLRSRGARRLCLQQCLDGVQNDELLFRDSDFAAAQQSEVAASSLAAVDLSPRFGRMRGVGTSTAVCGHQ